MSFMTLNSKYPANDIFFLPDEATAAHIFIEKTANPSIFKVGFIEWSYLLLFVCLNQ